MPKYISNMYCTPRQALQEAIRSRNFTADLAAPAHPAAVLRAEDERITSLALAVAAGRISLAEARAQLRGAA